MSNHILIIDDDIELCRLVRKYLEVENLKVDIRHNGKEGLNTAQSKSYHLLVLDVMLPEMNGFEVLAELRKSSAVPVLMLTAKDSEIDKVSGLRLGADDYLTKPFSMNEFVARVQSLIRRYTTLNSFEAQVEDSLEVGALSIDPKTREVLIESKRVELTVKEFDLLYFLAKNKGQVFTKKQIYCNVWQEEYAFDDNNIMVHIRRLRKKIEPISESPIYIQTVWGVGYKFNREV
ncbi:response regulator transcription factor [Paenibacillus sp. KN14-4R]|uniref:response regulator transcription factor n=1 Tax=Paenibacillus sp. KN14-4R TaxID=3445773 RepID=UPI003F9FC2D0